MPVKGTKSITINGVTHELHYISDLAYAIGRTDLTVRKWEISGVIPPTCFRDKHGRRMYTTAQINIIAKIAEECQIKQGAKMSDTSFSAKVHRALNEHNKVYIQQKEAKK